MKLCFAYEAAINTVFLSKYTVLQHLNYFFFYFQKTENTRKFNIESEILLFFWQSPVNYQWAGTLGKAERQRPTLARATISLRKSPDVSDIISFSSSVLYTRKQKILFQLKVSYKYLITRTVPDDCSMHSNI